MHLFVFTSALLQAISWRSKYNGVLEKSENKVEGSNPKVEGSSPSKTFFIYFFIFFCFRKDAGNFRDLHLCRKSMF